MSVIIFYNRMKMVINNTLMLPLHIISYIVPKNKKVWVFGSWFGNKFSDNSKYLYLYIKHNKPGFRPIWLSKDKYLLKRLKKYGYESYYTYSLNGIYYSMISSVVIVSTGLKDINYFVIGGAKKIQLWHGTPLKHICLDDEVSTSYYKKNMSFLLKDFVEKLYKIIFPFTKNKYDFLISSSPEVSKNLHTAFNIDNIITTGYPRNDTLYGYKWTQCAEDYAYLEKNCKSIHYDYIIVYLPTHRSEGRKSADLLAPYGFNPQEMQKLLEKLNGVLIIKAHFYNKNIILKSNDDILNKCTRIYMPSEDEIPDVYPILKNTDLLITDYSSVYFDFLLLDKPIIFAPFDLAEYLLDDRKLYYEYDSVTPGPKAYNWKEVMKYMNEAINEPDKYKEERSHISQIFNTFADGQNSKRVYQKIIEILDDS
jgi:CDP-glycerol glycerophosphotransferase (TagB/SpsB family)